MVLVLCCYDFDMVWYGLVWFGYIFGTAWYGFVMVLVWCLYGSGMVLVLFCYDLDMVVVWFGMGLVWC